MRRITASAAFCFIGWFFVLPAGIELQPLARGQDAEANAIQQHLGSGEFALARQLAEQAAGSERDVLLAQVAQSQAQGGAIDGAFESAGRIGDSRLRYQTYGSLQQSPGSEAPSSSGQSGGITAADFTDLIQLIQNSIEPTSWDSDDTSIRPYPAGVLVDAQGTLSRIPVDTLRDWASRRRVLGSDSGNREVQRPSPLRKISLTRLESRLAECVLRGVRPSLEMQTLAGLYRVDTLSIDTESAEVVIAGPAGPVVRADDGRWVNAESRQPVVLLDDLVVCLQNAARGGGRFGCSIDPRAENLQRTRSFLENTRLKDRAFRDGLQDALGWQDINIHGIDPSSHAAQVLVEADYLMKCLGIGLAPSIEEVPSFWDRIDPETADGSLDVVRWWFTMNYDAVLLSADGTMAELRGPGVRVASENELLDAAGNRVHTGQSSTANAGFAADFTRHYDALARVYPALGQLRNVFDLALIAAIVNRHRVATPTGWGAEFFLAEPDSDAGLTVQLPRLAPPRTVQTAMNHRYSDVTAGGRRQRRMTVGVGGGVEFDAGAVLNQKSQVVPSSDLARASEARVAPTAGGPWWWD